MLRVGIIVISAFALAGCGKKAALEEATKMEAACEAKDKAKASEIAQKAYQSDETFKKAFDETFKGADVAKANVCGMYGVELKARLSH